MGTLTAKAPGPTRLRAPLHGASHRCTHPRQLDPRWLIDAALRAKSGDRHERGVDSEWALIDTRGCDPGMYVIREWTDAAGIPHCVERSASIRRGGAIGLFTLEHDCASVGPCPTGVDEGAGLLLVGFAAMLAMPLPACSETALRANWLVIFSGRANAFPDAEVYRLVLLTHALLADPTLIDDRGRMDDPRAALSRAALAPSDTLFACP